MSVRRTIRSGAPQEAGSSGSAKVLRTVTSGTATSARARGWTVSASTSSTRRDVVGEPSRATVRCSPGPSSTTSLSPVSVRTRTTWLSEAWLPPVSRTDVGDSSWSKVTAHQARPLRPSPEAHSVSASPSTAAYGDSPRLEPPTSPESEADELADSALAPRSSAIRGVAACTSSWSS